MAVYVTDEGRAALLLGPVDLGDYKLGSAYGYTPDDTDTDIRGSLVLTGATSAPIVTYTNLYNYTIDLPAATELTFGEIALFFPGGNLFALYSLDELVHKTADPADLDGSGGTIHTFVPASGEIIVDLNEGELLGQITTVDNLPKASISPRQLFTVVHPVYTPVPILAFRLYDLWGITNYTQKFDAVVTSAGLNRVTTVDFYDAQPGDVLQFTDGPYKGICRKILSSHYTPNETTFVFVTPLSGPAPTAGTPFIVNTPFNAGTGTGGSGGGVSNIAILRDGSVMMDATFNMGGYSIANLANPLSATDAATKGYVDQQILGVTANSQYLLRDGSRPMTANFNFAGFKGINVGTPTAGTDAANKDYVDSVVSTGGLPAGPVNQNNQRIINLGNPTLSTDAVNKQYVDSSLGNYLPRSGASPMLGSLNMGAQRITNLQTPQIGSDAATKLYVDQAISPTVNTHTGVTGAQSYNIAGMSQLKIWLVGNTVISFTGGTAGQRFVLRVTQDGSASRTLSFGSMVRFSQDIPSYTLTTTAGRTDYLGFLVDYDSGGSVITYNLLAVVQGY